MSLPGRHPQVRDLRQGHASDGKRRMIWTSAHQGVMNFGQGCALGIRNLNMHATGELTEQEALEQLAAPSVRARWVDECEVVSVAGDAVGE